MSQHESESTTAPKGAIGDFVSKLLPPLVLAVLIWVGSGYFTSKELMADMRGQVAQLTVRVDKSSDVNETQASLIAETTRQMAVIANEQKNLAEKMKDLQVELSAIKSHR